MGLRRLWDALEVFHWPGAARSLREKLADAAQVNKVTGICPSVAIHIPWDKVDDWQAVKAYVGSLGLRIGAVNPNLFQEDVYRLGSLCHFDKKVREQAVEHVIDCIHIAQVVGSDVISLWLADGTNYPGQDDLRRRRHRLLDSLQAIYAAMPAGMRPLLAEVRVRQGRGPDPIAAFRSSGYAERVARERVASPMASGYPGA